MMKCVGLAYKNGEFRDDSGKVIKYDNVVLYCTVSLPPDENVFGLQTTEVKIKRSNLDLFLGGYFHPDDIVGHEIQLDYTPLNNKPVLTGIHIFDSIDSGKK